MAAATEEQRLARVGATARRCEKPQLDKGFQGNDNAKDIFQHNARLVACVVNADAC